MTTDFQDRIVGAVGRKGAGKTTRIATLLKYAPRVFVWDSMGDHEEWLPDVAETIDEVDEYFDLARRAKTFACGYAPVNDPVEEFEEICDLVYHRLATAAWARPRHHRGRYASQ